jgi:hypothetical protein
MTKPSNRYAQIIESVFLKYYHAGAEEVPFERSDLIQAANALHIKTPKNIGDILYSFRYRTALPQSIIEKAPEGYEWIIRPIGKARYAFVLTRKNRIVPSEMLVETKIPDATPGVISRYAINDEQGLLARLRYNRLIDVFTGLTCYSLQNHLRTTVPGIGQVETDEIYIGLDKRGVQYVLPVQAKGGTDQIGIVQIEQDFAICMTKFPELICRSIAAQFMRDDVIALFEFEQIEGEIAIASEKHYRLVHPEDLSIDELQMYQKRSV